MQRFIAKSRRSRVGGELQSMMLSDTCEGRAGARRMGEKSLRFPRPSEKVCIGLQGPQGRDGLWRSPVSSGSKAQP